MMSREVRDTPSITNISGCSCCESSGGRSFIVSLPVRPTGSDLIALFERRFDHWLRGTTALLRDGEAVERVPSVALPSAVMDRPEIGDEVSCGLPVNKHACAAPAERESRW
jgi:hypothetical protein